MGASHFCRGEAFGRRIYKSKQRIYNPNASPSSGDLPKLDTPKKITYLPFTIPLFAYSPLPIPHCLFPITDSPLPITDYRFPITDSPLPITIGENHG
jgi:hypothetical protein